MFDIFIFIIFTWSWSYRIALLTKQILRVPIRVKKNIYLQFLIHFVGCSDCSDLILACLMCQKMFAGYTRSTGTQIFSICLRISGMRGAEQAQGFYHIWDKLCNIKITQKTVQIFFSENSEKHFVVYVLCGHHAGLLPCCPEGAGVCVWSRQLISVPTLRERERGQLIGIV